MQPTAPPLPPPTSPATSQATSFGRLIAAAVADHLGLPATFLTLAALNLSGAVVVYLLAGAHAAHGRHGPVEAAVRRLVGASLMHFRNPPLRAAFGIGFCILFAFIGTFTYVNFVLVRAPLSLSMMGVGFVYFVFLPSIITTPIAGRVAAPLRHADHIQERRCSSP